MLALFCVKPVLAVFSDEAGVVDWHRKSLGLLKASPAPELYYSQHKSDHVIARINTTDGSIFWRKLFSFEANGPATPLLLSNYLPENEKGILVVGFSAEETCKLTSFDVTTGSVVWEVTVNGNCIDITFVKDFNGVYALTSSALYKIGSVAGAVLGQFTPELLHEPIEFAALSASGIILEDTSAGSLLEYKFTEEHSSQVKPHKDPFASSPLVLGPGKVVAYSDDGHTVWEEENKTSGEDIKPPTVHLDSKGELKSSSPADVFFLNGKVVITVSNTVIQAYSIETSELIYTIDNVGIFSKIDATKFAITKDSNIEIIDIKTGDIVSKQPFDQPITLITPSFIQYANGIVKPLSDQFKWTRDESLAHLDAALILDYPDDRKVSLDVKEALLEEHSNIYVAYVRRLSRHVRDLLWLIKKIAENPNALFSWSWLSSASSTDGTSANDAYFGFKKYFIAISQTGRIQALDSTKSGETVWVKDLLTPRAHGSPKFLVTSLEEKVTVVDPSTNKVITLDGLTGNILEEATVLLESDDSISRILTLYLPGIQTTTEEEDIDSVTAEEKTETSVLLTTSGKLYGLDGQVFSSPVPIYITKTLEDKSALVGLFVNGTSISQIWRFNVPSDHVIQNVASRHELDFTVNIGQVLSDRSVLYKYLHNNLLAITATGPGSLYVYLLDSASGRILHSKHHNTGTGIDKYAVDEYTHLVVGENWIVYTYWSTNPTLGQIVVVWDLYESEISNQRTMAKKNKKGKLESAPYSSFDNFEDPFVKSQAYYIPTQHARVTGLGITRTRYGITLRDVIAATSRNQILSLPKRGNYLSARRPVDRDPTSAEASEEGISRYDSLLPYDPARQVLSHTRQVVRVSTLLTVPTVLESTSIVIGYGLDIFGTKVAPSGLFDVLTPSFGRDKLIYTMAAMTGLALYLKPLVAKRKTNNFWGN